MSEPNLQIPENQDNHTHSNKSDSSKPPNETQTPKSRRQALTNVRRQLTDEELANPGLQKLLLDMLEIAESERDSNKIYITSFYEADKKAAILGERLLADKRVDIFFGVGVGLGGTIVGLSPFFGEIKGFYGIICAIIGVVLIGGSSIGRAIKK